jgi:hypothetical protein
MIRKHLRLKRLVLGLAVSFAIAAVSAPAVLAKPTSGNGPLDPWAYNVIHRGAQATVMTSGNGPLDPWAYNVIHGGAQATVMTSGNGPLDPWAYNVIHGGAQATVMPVVRYSAVSGPLGIAAYQSFAGTTPSAQRRVISQSGFDWGDAGIGALVAFGIALLLLTAVALGRRSRSRIGDRSGLATS